MGRIVFSVLIVLVIGGPGGCGNVVEGTHPSESTFMAGFSLAPILEANEQYLAARHTISGSSV
jgi:hypothetical protein